MITQPKAKNNPLAGIMRQPKIYIQLPSGGEFYPPGTLVKTETGQYPVYSMTAKDELMLKVPDALISGQAIVDVIQNCMPNIKNAWEVPNIDIDVILIAIRIATYGEKMKVPLDTKDFDAEYEVDLRNVMSELVNQITWDVAVPINEELIVYVKPMNYKQMSESAVQSFETQKIMQIANDTGMSDDEKVKLFKETFDKLNALTIGIVNNTVFQIESTHGNTNDPQHIKEFMENCDKEIFDTVRKHLETLRDLNTIKPVKVQPTKEMIEGGFADETIEVPLSFDASTFFA